MLVRCMEGENKGCYTLYFEFESKFLKKFKSKKFEFKTFESKQFEKKFV